MYPHCERLGLLRKTNRGATIVSTAALYKHLGPKRYRSVLPQLTYVDGLLPGPVEEWLRSRKGK